MKATIKHCIRFIFTIIGKYYAEKLITKIADLSNVNLLRLAYRNIGILNYYDMLASGEKHLLHKVLKNYTRAITPIIFDIGANIGTYSEELRRIYPDATIYAFEPNSETFNVMKSRLRPHQVKCYNFGFGKAIETVQAYTYDEDKTGEHTTLYKSVITDLHKRENIRTIKYELTTLDNFSHTNNIPFIDFVKIDTEGSEIDVLYGAANMIASNKIGIIQFEFNEMNIISRVFLKDFYNLLNEYDIYRLAPNNLIPLPNYNPINEIFKFQNLLAINKHVHSMNRGQEVNASEDNSDLNISDHPVTHYSDNRHAHS